MREFPFTLSASAVIGGGTLAGSVTSGTSFDQFLTYSGLPAGTYTVAWTVTLSGSLSSGDANNFMLMFGPPGGPHTQIAQSVNAAAAGSYAQAQQTVTLAAGQALVVKTWSNTPTAGSVYAATVTAAAVTTTASAGPSFPRESWDVSVASVSVSSNTNEAIAKIYAGPQATQGSFVDGTTWGSTGDSTSSFSAPVYLGSQVFAVWTGGDPGATATLVVTGTRRIP